MQKVDLNALDPAMESDADKLHRVARLGIGLVPVAGCPLLELFGSVLETPLNKRKTETMIQIGEIINQLIDDGVVTEKGLQENEVFVSTVAEACAISLRNHQEEKLEALRNAVRNSALPRCPADDYRQLFLNFVDVCTVTHIRLLHLFHDPELWCKNQNLTLPNWGMGGLSSVAEFALPELKGQDELYRSIWKDLYQRGLVNTGSMGGTMSRVGMLASRTTQIGAQLINFLSKQ
ncbi:hypothetical protein [Pseudomonas sp. M5]|uniref:hypothetical protein n=1 Tax=Pseudomonas sp. M5 TaxID=1620788 RepID=UPI00195D8822|nr:hypothetical protein [Pseudomonas sp. M5]MBM7395510.1 hypothetical protein [Pseudomonas sp. M5]HDS1758835.1 hypothetical protein [Pseudomonas putida]